MTKWQKVPVRLARSRLGVHALAGLDRVVVFRLHELARDADRDRLPRLSSLRNERPARRPHRTRDPAGRLQELKRPVRVLGRLEADWIFVVVAHMVEREGFREPPHKQLKNKEFLNCSVGFVHQCGVLNWPLRALSTIAESAPSPETMRETGEHPLFLRKKITINSCVGTLEFPHGSQSTMWAGK